MSAAPSWPPGGSASAGVPATLPDPAAVPDPAALPVTPGASWWNVANAVTVARLMLVPVVLVLLFADGGHQPAWRVASAVVFAVASLTDRVDGQLARRRGLVTSFGKLADPIADKALTGAALVGLTLLGELPLWVTVTVLAREVGVTLLRFSVLRHGVIPASRGGKVKTALQGLAIGCYLLPLGGGVPGVVRAVLLGVAVAVTLVTGGDYVLRALALRRTAGG